MERTQVNTQLFKEAELARLDQLKAAVADRYSGMAQSHDRTSTIVIASEAKQSLTIAQFSNESITPFLDINKSASHYRFLVEEHGEAKGTEIARQTFIRDLESQAWELSEIPTPYKYKLLIKGEKLIHESNLEDETDIDEIVSDKIRKGLEKRQVRLYKKTTKEMAVGETAVRLSPKKLPNEQASDCPYPDSQLFLSQKVLIDGKEWVAERQFQCDLNEKELAKAFNLLLGKDLIDPESGLENILLTLASTSEYISDQAVWQAMEKASGRKLFKKSLDEYHEIQTRLQRNSVIGGEKLLGLIKNGVVGQELKSSQVNILMEVLGDIQSSKVHQDKTTGSFFFESSCGSGGSSRGISTGHKEGEVRVLYCKNVPVCGETNVCYSENKTCFKCGSKLADS